MNAPLIYECPITAIEIGYFDFKRLRPLDFYASMLPADQIVQVSIITNLTGRVSADSETAEVIQWKFLYLIFAAGTYMPRDYPDVQWFHLLGGLPSILTDKWLLVNA
jgi:hypothetical protein